MNDHNIRYVLHPGYITSPHDGDRHYIGARELARLYGVLFHQCVVDNGLNKPRHIDAVHLYPKSSGRYNLPES